MKIYIITDLEGTALVAGWEEIQPDTAGFNTARRRATTEVNAAIAGILDYDGNAEIYVLEGHRNGLIKDELHEKALVLTGRFQPPRLLDQTFDGLFFIGQHAMANTPNAVLAHTFTREVESCRLNGCTVGEFGCHAAVAGTFNVPALFISGDDKAVAEAAALVPGIIGVAVKKSYGTARALSLSPAAACRRIREKAAQACAGREKIKPLLIAAPYELEMRYAAPRDFYLNANMSLPDDRTVVYRHDDICGLPI